MIKTFDGVSLTNSDDDDFEVKKMRKISSIAIFLVLIIPILSAATVTSLYAPGDLDPTFSGDGKLTDWAGYATGVVIQPDGKIVVAFGPNFSVARYNPDGSRDISFGDNGRASVSFGSENASAHGIAIQSDGKIVVAGYVCPCDDWGSAAFAVARFDPDGSLDLSFDGDGKVTTAIGGRTTGYSVTVQPDNKIIVAGWSWEAAPPYVKDHFAVARYNPDGSLDTTFGGDGTVTTSICANCNDEAFSVAVQPDGKIVAVGGGFDGTNHPKFEVVRYNANGSLDTTFDSEGLLTTSFGGAQIAYSVAIQGDGKIVAGGTGWSSSSGNEFVLARYNTNGSLDTTFDSDGKVTTGANAGAGLSSIAIQSDGKIIASGWTSTGFDGNDEDFMIVRYDQDGSLDNPFGVVSVDFNNSIAAAFDIALDSAGRAVVVGQSGGIAIARLLADPQSAIFDYDGDGRADLSVRRPSDNVWHLLRATAGYTAMEFGVAGDRMTPADYDGDGKTDVAVFRPSNGTWYVYMSQSQTFQAFGWGQDGDLPVPTDRDADNKTDLVIFRPSNNTWYTRFANGTFAETQFGVAGDKPLVGDFDADGKGDIAVFRPNNNNWYIIKSSLGFFIQTWGEAGDIPVTGDFDGDGASDQAVFRPSTGQWFKSQTSAGFESQTWGEAGDIPVAADYDGDGRTDIAVFRPSNGTWYIVGSTNGILIQQFGQNGDIPTQSAYVY